MEIVEFAGYTEREKAEIARRYLVPRQLREAGLVDEKAPDRLHLRSRRHRRDRDASTPASGVRQARTRNRARRAQARPEARGGRRSVRNSIDVERVHDLLGRARVRPEHAASRGRGRRRDGHVLRADRRRHHVRGGRGAAPRARRDEHDDGEIGLILTGQLGEVDARVRARGAHLRDDARRRSSASRSIGSARSRCTSTCRPAPSPKDGPSAGVTMATALASALSGRAARKEVAMTGEITPAGPRAPIGGVKEKVLGAERAEISEIILPEANLPDLDDLPPGGAARAHDPRRLDAERSARGSARSRASGGRIRRGVAPGPRASTRAPLRQLTRPPLRAGRLRRAPGARPPAPRRRAAHRREERPPTRRWRDRRAAPRSPDSRPPRSRRARRARRR